MESSSSFVRTPLQKWVLTGFTVILVYFLQTSEWFYLVYPFRLFTTLIHEMGHSMATLITGGQIVEFVVKSDQSGYARNSGGNLGVILTSGYLGTAVFGSSLFFLNNRYKVSKITASIVGLSCVSVSIFFGSGVLTVILGIGSGLFLLVLSQYAPSWLVALVVNVLSVTMALEAIRSVHMLAKFSNSGDINDAEIFSTVITPWLPGWFIATIWAGIAIALFLAACYWGIWRTAGNNGSSKVK